MSIHIKDLRRHYNDDPGDLLVAMVGGTEVIIDTGREQVGVPDIRIDDGQHIHKLVLDSEMQVQRVLRDDVPLHGHGHDREA